MSTGMPWYIALLFNLFSSLTAIVGFFVGVAISSISEDANGWILAVAAGIFLYIALVDLVSYTTCTCLIYVCICNTVLIIVSSELSRATYVYF